MHIALPCCHLFWPLLKHAMMMIEVCRLFLMALRKLLMSVLSAPGDPIATFGQHSFLLYTFLQHSTHCVLLRD